jgi:hypothetical protein
VGHLLDERTSPGPRWAGRVVWALVSHRTEVLDPRIALHEHSSIPTLVGTHVSCTAVSGRGIMWCSAYIAVLGCM